MIFIYILSAVLVLIFAVLMLNLRVTVKYGNKTYVKIGVLFFDYNLTTKKKDKKSFVKKQKKSAENIEKGSKDKKNILSEFTDGLEISDFLQLLRILIVRMVESSSGHVKVRVKTLQITVADKMPATAAMLYGGVNAAVSWLLEYLTVNTKLYPLNKSSVYINCDFDKEKTEAEIELYARIRIVHLVKFVLKFFFDFIKLKENKNQTSLKGTK